MLSTALAIAIIAAPDAPTTGEKLLTQPLAALLDTCDPATGVRRIGAATLDECGQVEDRLELRTAQHGAGSVAEYLVNDIVVFSHGLGEDLQVSPSGATLLADASPRGIKVLGAFAAMHARVFAANVGAPPDACGPTRGKAEQQAKCAFIGLIGCVPPAAAFTCGVSAALAIGCTWLVEKACESEPETCEPGWTEG